MGWAAVLGAGATVGGNAMNANGQARGAEAMQHVYEMERRRQAEDDAQLQAATQDLIAKAGGALDQQPKVDALRTDLVNVGAKTANAVAANQNRHTGNAETNALITSGIAGDRHQAAFNAGLMARLQALGLSLHDLNMLGREFSLRRGALGADQRDRGRLLPMALSLAGTAGGTQRTAGATISGLGQAAMQYGMSQPRSSGGATAATTTAPPAGTVSTAEGAFGPGYDFIGRPVYYGAT